MLFRTFDSRCKDSDVIKIEAVGNTLVCASGLSFAEKHSKPKIKNPILRLIFFALDIIHDAKTISWGDKKKVALRAGIHYGSVISGIIGQFKPQLMILGTAVSTANLIMTMGE